MDGEAQRLSAHGGGSNLQLPSQLLRVLGIAPADHRGGVIHERAADHPLAFCPQEGLAALLTPSAGLARPRAHLGLVLGALGLRGRGPSAGDAMPWQAQAGGG